MMDDALTMDEAGGWNVAGVMTDLQGALLTTLCAEAGLAGTVELETELQQAANDERWEDAMV